MRKEETLENRRLTWLLLFVGFCCVCGWVGMNFVLLTNYTNSRHFAGLGAVLRTVAMALTSTSFYAVIGAAALVWGIRRYRRTANRQDLIGRSLIPAIILSPLVTIGGMGVMLMAPFVFGHAREMLLGPNVVQSSRSPDGARLAYVVDKPSIDGPNHHLYMEDAAGVSTFVANLPEDVDYNREIIWSPHSDIVVFCTHFKLIAYCPASGETQEVVLGGERHYRKNGTFWVDYGNVLKATDLEFPDSGVFSYRLEGVEGSFTLTFG